jgi:acetyltransferase-like isoleucine patch superfamily enzyme
MTHLDHDWHHEPVPDGVRLGERSWLYSSFAFVHCRSRRPAPVVVGADSGVYHGTFFELGPSAEVEVGAFSTLVGAIVRTDRRVRIGDHVFIAHEVFIADDEFAVPPPPEAAGGEPQQGLVVEDGAWIGARAILHGPSRIGRDAVVGAGAVVTRDVPAGATVAGNPALVVTRAS